MHGERFKPMALLPMRDAGESASELQQCVMKYKFVGGVLGYIRDGGGSRYEDAEW